MPTSGSPKPQSSLRERHVEQTREVIFQALTEQLAKGGFEDFSIPGLARRAGVSVRTIYRHFPSRDDLLEALAEWLDDQIAAPPDAATVDDLETWSERLFPAFDENEDILLAQSATEPGRAVRARGRQRHIRIYKEILEELISGLPPAERQGAFAVIVHLLSTSTWRTMKDEFNMRGEESGKAVAWAVQTLLAEIRRRAGE